MINVCPNDYEAVFITEMSPYLPYVLHFIIKKKKSLRPLSYAIFLNKFLCNSNFSKQFYNNYIVLCYSIRVWDIAILIPNIIFIVYLVTKFNRVRLKLRAANSPIFFTFYCLVTIIYFFNVYKNTYNNIFKNYLFY